MAKSINPFTLKLIKEYKEYSPAEIEKKLKASHAAYIEWKKTPFKTREKLFLALAANLKKNAKKYGQIMTDEMGKPLADSVAEIEKCSKTCEYFAKNGTKFLKIEEIESEFKKSQVVFNPIGIVFAIMPWNFPFWQAFRAIVPAIFAGNSMVLKHSSNVTGSALLIEKIMLDSGFPKHLFQTLIIAGKDADKLIAHELIKGVTFTGSTDVGKKIAGTAGANLKKAVLELGGNDPYIVLSDADVKLAAEKCAASRLINAGQSCIAAKRFIVSAKVYDKFIKAFTANMKIAKYGNPNDKTSKIGPLVSIDARDKIHETVQKYVSSKSAKLLAGGFIPKEQGAFYPPTVLEVLKPAQIADAEIFGPVAMVFKAKDDNDAIKIANDTNFGLGAAVFGKYSRALKLAEEEVESGSVAVNDFVKSDPRFPFGGVKQSGYGRELSHFGILEFVNIKSVVAS